MAKKPTSLLKPDDYEWTWADFDDWDVKTHEDYWSEGDGNFGDLTRKQKSVVNNNKCLLHDRSAWDQRVKEFRSLLMQEPEEYRQEIQKDFAIRFDGAVFESHFNLIGIIFPCPTYFILTSFALDIDFNNAVFQSSVTFESVIFKCEMASFRKVKFLGYVVYGHVNFYGHSDFREVHFKSDVIFEYITFYESANFEKFKSDGDILIYNSTFESSLNMENSLIVGNFDFFDADFLFLLLLRDLEVNGNFQLTSKIERSDFRRIKVDGSVLLTGSEFEDVPDFRDCRFNGPIEVGGMLVPPPKLARTAVNEFKEVISKSWLKLSQDFDDVAKYRKLKAMALAANDHEKDGEFFAYEMMAKRGHETTGFFPLLLNSLYWILSFYGQSIARPLIWMFVSFLSFWAGGLAMIKYMTGSSQEIGFAAVHSALNSMPLIGTLFRTTSTPKGHTSWYDETYHQLADKGLSLDLWAALSAFQQIVGAVLFFLFFLGLRNKFRLK